MNLSKIFQRNARPKPNTYNQTKKNLYKLVLGFALIVGVSSQAYACRFNPNNMDPPSASPRTYDPIDWQETFEDGYHLWMGTYDMINTDQLMIYYRFCNEFHFKAVITSETERTLNHMSVMLANVFTAFSPIDGDFRYDLDKIIYESFINELNKNPKTERVVLPKAFVKNKHTKYLFYYSQDKKTATFYYSKLR